MGNCQGAYWRSDIQHPGGRYRGSSAHCGLRTNPDDITTAGDSPAETGADNGFKAACPQPDGGIRLSGTGFFLADQHGCIS